MNTLAYRYAGFSSKFGAPVDGAYDLALPFSGTISGTGKTIFSQTGTNGISSYFYAWWTKNLYGLKVYAEAKPTTISNGSNHIPIGVGTSSFNSAIINYIAGDVSGPDSYPGAAYRNNGTLFVDGGPFTYSSFTTNDIIGIAFNGTNGEITFYKNNVIVGGTFSVRGWGSYDKWHFLTELFDDYTNTAVTEIQTTQNYSPPTGFTWIGDIPY